MKIRPMIVVAGFATLAVVGCEDKKSPVKVPEAMKDAGKAASDAAKGAADATKDAAKGAADAASNAWEKVKAEAVTAMEGKLADGKAALESLKKSAEGITDPAKKVAATPLVESASKAFADLSSKFEAFKSGDSGTWEKLKSAADDALKVFNEAMAKAKDLVK